MQVKPQIIQLISTNSLEKVFYAETFLDQFSVSKQKQAQIKRFIVETFNELQKYELIEKQFKLTNKSGRTKETDKLIPLLIGQSRSIYFDEKL